MRRGNTQRAFRFFTTFILSFFISILVTGAYVVNKSRMEYTQLEQLVEEKSNKIQRVISSLLFKTQVLSALVIQNNGQIRDFNRVAATVLDDPAIRNIIIAPGGVITNVYPVKGNESVLGFDYFSDHEGNQEAIQARDSGQLVLGGPFNLVQGGQALVGRLPVYMEDQDGDSQFWGLVSVTLNYPQALEGAELQQLENKKIAFEIWRISPDTGQRQVIAKNSYDSPPQSRYLEKSITILNAQWFFRISPVRYWYEFPETWILTAIGACVSLLFALLVLHNHDLIYIKRELEEVTYTDPLTGILNRRGIFKVMEELMTRETARFVLCYFDLNKFKQINDRYGHINGDYVLKKMAETFVSHMDANYAFGRIGGDEFVLIGKNMMDCSQIYSLVEAVREDLKQPVLLDSGEAVHIVFSMGKAIYPEDGSTADELLASADAVMYREKSSGQSGGPVSGGSG